MDVPPVAVVMPTRWSISSILAHQGGWDEILLVVGPLALIAGALWLANRRVTAQLAAQEAEEAQREREAAEAEDVDRLH